MPDLLIEILSEEIPARMQARAAGDLKRLVTDGLVEAGLTYGSAEAFATPRRLALAVEGLTAESPAKREDRKGPRTDAPDKALEGFLRSTGLTKDQLEARDDKKGQVWFAVIEHAGRPAADIVAEVLGAAIQNFPWPKSMRWGAGELRWVRPLQGIICLLSDEAGATVVPVTVGGVTPGDTTRGHRIHAPNPVQVTGFDDYAAKLRTAHVILSPEERAERIWHDATTLAFAQGLEVVEDKALLSEVAGLVEWPVALMGAIDATFLELPPEVLQTSMREHQKFFSVRNPASGRIEQYITVANVETEDAGAAILRGNGKVLTARLSDAKFFWENDLRKVEDAGLEAMAASLENVTFHAKLGSQAARVARIEALARDIAPMVGADPDLAAQAARVAKADLASEMVYEFPELQGLMGGYYARAEGLPEDVAAACAAHYAPLGPSDDVPEAPVSVAVALADKIDTLTGFWAIDEKPTGSKDPYALRRAALGVIRLVLANGLGISLDRFIEAGLVHHAGHVSAHAAPDQIKALVREIAEHRVFGAAFRALRDAHEDGLHGDVESLGETIPGQSADLLAFLHDRLKVHLKGEGIRHDVIDAALAMPGSDDLGRLVARAQALQAVLGTDDGENLIQGFKRANNILTQAEAEDGVEYSYGPDEKLAETDTERALFAALDKAEAEIAPAMAADDFEAAMAATAKLRAPIDAFFEDVQVNAENAILRRNRLNLLHLIRTICTAVADLSRISG
jgi:glycyl-tRNA synthetase beta chain